MKLLRKKHEIVQKQEVIPVRDLKEYLVKDFEQIKENEEEISNLKERIDMLEEIEAKYKFTLITLEEFDSRVAREKEKAIKLEDKNNSLKEEIKKLEEQKNNCIIRERQALEKINNVKDTILAEYKKDLKEIINKTKGTLSKKKVCDIIEKLD